MEKRLTTALAAGAILAAMLPGTPILAQDMPWTVVAEGIDAPRGLAFSTDGKLYVALAGAGGDDCFEAPGPEGEPTQVCIGTTGSISSVDVTTGEVTPVIGGLGSVFAAADGVLGPSDVAIDDAGDIYYLTGDGNVPDPTERAAGDLGGIVWKAGADGTAEQVIDLIAFEAEANPDGGLLDSNPNGVAIVPDGGLLVADAGANALLMIDPDGSASVVAVFPDGMTEMPAMPAEGAEAAEEAPSEGDETAAAEPEMIPYQAVPTSVTIGPDGDAYVTFLTGFPFPAGGAWVARVAAGEEPTVYADGFTNVIDAAFASDGTLYVLEIFTNGMLSGDPTGGLWSVPPGGGEATLVASDGLMTPGGLAIGADDTVYVSNGSAFPGQGAIVRLDQ